MLPESNNAQLSAKQIKAECIPFYQIWQEFLDSRTLDVYRCRILNSLDALFEMQNVITKTLSGLFTTDANIESCREELLFLLNHDDVLAKHYKPQQDRLRASLGRKPGTPADKNRLLQQLGYATKSIKAKYLEYALDDLFESIQNADIKSIGYLANIVASHSISNGWSEQGLSDLIRFFTTDEAFPQQWAHFKQVLLSPAVPEHLVLINVPFRNQKAEDQANTVSTLQGLGLSVKTHGDIVAMLPEIGDIERLINANKRYFCVTVSAKDIYAAAHIAIAKISEQLNIASFYNLVDAWDLQSVVLVSINMQSKYHRSFSAKFLYSTYEYLDSSGRIFDDTKRIFADENNAIIRDKLQGSFGYTNISRSSLFQEEKYMNLWVALESLSRTNMYSDIISCIKGTVPAAVSLRYVYRIVRNYVEDCKRCRIDLSFSTCSIDTEQLTKQKMVKEMISVFKDNTLLAELQSKCSINSLLESRTNDIHCLLTDVNYAKDKIENHYKQVSWQIQRLYRIRNEIAHSALHESTSLIVYIEHLSHYLSSYISEIVTCIVEKNLSSIEEALCCIRDNYDVFLSLADSPDKSLIENDVMQTGIIDLISFQ